MTDCTVTASSSGTGGGIYNRGTLHLNRCTISGNKADDGGGIASTGTLDATNCTLNGNVAGTGGAISHSGIGTARYCTIADNVTTVSGGALHEVISTGKTLDMKAFLFSNNLGPGGPQDCDGEIHSSGYNVLQTDTGCTLDVFGPPDVTGVKASLGSLQRNGGATRARALHAGHPAIDSIPAGDCISEDQRAPPCTPRSSTATR